MIIRSFRWSDLPVLADFINQGKTAVGDEPLVNPSSLKEQLGQPGLDPENNCSLIEDANGLAAYSILHPELSIGRAVLEVGIQPQLAEADVGEILVRWARSRAEALGARVLHLCVPTSEGWGGLLQREGFSEVRVYWLMRWQQGQVSSIALPAGTAIESFRPGDEARLTKVQNASFDGNWGFCPNSIEEIAYRTGMAMSPPGGILFLTQGDETVGYCWSCILGDSQNHIGVIGMIGVTPPFRGRGLSRPILRAGMEFLRSRGVKYISLDVDGENVPAIKLYSSEGFKKDRELHWFEAPLSGG